MIQLKYSTLEEAKAWRKKCWVKVILAQQELEACCGGPGKRRLRLKVGLAHDEWAEAVSQCFRFGIERTERTQGRPV